MSKGPTKAQQALAEAREWIEASKEEIREREAALAEAHNQLKMHETIYAVLEKTLTRQVAQKSSSKKPTKTTNARCRFQLASGSPCNMTATHGIHDLETKDSYVESHEFQPTKTAGKLRRAAGLSARLGKSRDQQRQVATDDNDAERCMYTDDDGPCGYPPDANIHHLNSHPEFHPFTPASSAPPVSRQSSRNGGVPAQANDTQRTVSSTEPESDEPGTAASSTSASIATSSDTAHVAAGGSGES